MLGRRRRLGPGYRHRPAEVDDRVVLRYHTVPPAGAPAKNGPYGVVSHGDNRASPPLRTTAGPSIRLGPQGGIAPWGWPSPNRIPGAAPRLRTDFASRKERAVSKSPPRHTPADSDRLVRCIVWAAWTA